MYELVPRQEGVWGFAEHTQVMGSNDLAAAVATCQKDITAVGSGVVKQRGNVWVWPKTRTEVMALARKLGTIAQAGG